MTSAPEAVNRAAPSELATTMPSPSTYASRSITCESAGSHSVSTARSRALRTDGALSATVMAVTLEGQQEGTSAPRGGLGPALQPAGCNQAADQMTLMRVADEPFVLAPSLAR